MPLWDYIHIGRGGGGGGSAESHRNLQEGLFQIASQTCNILVQVNNTNNISYGNNTTNIQYNHFNTPCPGEPGPSRSATSSSSSSTSHATGGGVRTTSSSSSVDIEQSVILLPRSKSDGNQSIVKHHSNNNGRHNSFSGNRKQLFSNYRHRLSTVLENSGTPGGDDDFELWDQSQMLRSEQQGQVYKWGNGQWCKPSCIPISVILILIILVVLLPLLDHANDKHQANAKLNVSSPFCKDMCNIQLVESIPEGLIYPAGSPTFISTFDAWTNLIDLAENTLDIGSFYWSLRNNEIINHTSSWQGDKIFNSLLNLKRSRNIKIRIAQSAPTASQPNYDTEYLVKRKAAEVRSVNFPRLLGGGVLHTKLWIVDGKHFYIGSANMDWRSLTQVKELGVLMTNCSCMANDVAKIFNIYWKLGQEKAEIPPTWPEEYTTKYNANTSLSVNLNQNYEFLTYFSSSPPPLSAKGRSQDVDAIVNVILHAERFVYISVMDYFPLIIYSAKIQFWPHIDNAIRKAAIENKVIVRMLISRWNHSHESENYFLRSLQAISNSYRGINLEIKRFIVPATPDQARIPFARVNHNKYMVTDRTAYIGTSNWSGDYFTNTAGIGLVLTDPKHERNETTPTIRAELESVFERDWNSQYAVDLAYV